MWAVNPLGCMYAGTTRREEQHNSKAVPAWASEQQQMLAASGRLQPGTSLLLHQTCQVQGEDTAGDQPQGGAETEAGCSSSPGHMTISKSPEHTSQQVDSGSDEEDQQRSSAMKRYATSSSLITRQSAHHKQPVHCQFFFTRTNICLVS